jgi:hypothetical protein
VWTKPNAKRVHALLHPPDVTVHALDIDQCCGRVQRLQAHLRLLVILRAIDVWAPA